MISTLLNKVGRVLAYALVVGVLSSVAAAHAAPYGGGDYGDCKYNDGCPASTSNGSGTGTTTTTSEPTKPGEILLNNYQEYASDDGKQLDLKEDQKVSFDVTKDGETTRYTATVKEVGDDYVIIAIGPDNDKLRLELGETAQYDVDGDGVNDIEVTLVSIKDGVASLNFKQLVLGVSTVDTPTTPASTVTDEKTKSFNLIWILIPLIILAAGVWWLAALRRKHNKDKNIQF